MRLFRGWGVVAAAPVLLALVFGAGRFPVGSLFAATALLYDIVGAFPARHAPA